MEEAGRTTAKKKQRRTIKKEELTRIRTRRIKIDEH